MEVLSNKQVQLVELLGSGESISESARVLDVSRKTIYNWLEIEGMKSQIRERSSGAVIRLGKKIIASLEKNLPTIEGIFASKRSTNGEKIRAYGLLLNNARHINEISDVNERLLILEGQKQ